MTRVGMADPLDISNRFLFEQGNFRGFSIARESMTTMKTLTSFKCQVSA